MIRLQRALPDRFATATPEELATWIGAAKSALGDRLVILGHHYQRDDVMAWADYRGDSFGLSRAAADRPDADYIVFCGVHFMAEAADILTRPDQSVFLPDLNAGCSMADMADADDVHLAWEEIAQCTDIERVLPITYMNSSAALKAFVGAHGGAVCTSSNARAVLTWALEPDANGRSRADKVLFFPDEHLGRNTGFQLGYRAEEMARWDPTKEFGGLDEAAIKESTLILWRGFCSVHQRFQPRHIAEFRAAHPDGRVLVHPECSHEVVELADGVGSTDYLIREVASAPTGSVLGIGTEVHLVHRLANEHPDRTVVSLDPVVCPCSTMARIDPAHLAWLLERLVAGEAPNRITVDGEIARQARLALERMLSIV